MGSLGPPARAMAVRSAFALFCFALLCGLAASIQSETETDLTKEGAAAGDEVLVEQAVESRAARGVENNRIKKLTKKCNKNPKGKACKRLKERKRGRKNSRKATGKGKKANKKNGKEKKKGRSAKKKGGKKG